MTDKSDALIVFTPSGKRGRFALGTPVLTAARSLGVDIDSVCGGRAICGRCQINVGEGEFAKQVFPHRSHLSEFSQVEERYERLRGLAAGRRLSCQTHCFRCSCRRAARKAMCTAGDPQGSEVRDIEKAPATRAL